MKKFLKSLAGRALHHSGLRLKNWNSTGVVVAFHRVDDRLAGDAISISVDAFEQFCRFFKHHYDVIPLGDFITRLERGVDVTGSLSITFDDGYLDNYENAAPILRQFDLPATFFVTSDFIETDTVAWWDAEISPPPAWMSWDQVRALSNWGFEIGGHTRTHPNLAEVCGEVAFKEISGGRAILEKETGREVDLFAYPYGRVDGIAEENRGFVRDAGFRCCVSCHGGLATNRSDPFRLHRVPINGWFADAYQFGLEVLLSRK